jgi:hypothetical protein
MMQKSSNKILKIKKYSAANFFVGYIVLEIFEEMKGFQLV